MPFFAGCMCRHWMFCLRARDRPCRQRFWDHQLLTNSCNGFSSLYDIVLIDSPPALLVTDAVTISSKADAILWVSQAGVITRPQLARATDLIERNRIPVIGFVVNKIDSRSADYRYGYGYEYLGSYYGEEKPIDA